MGGRYGGLGNGENEMGRVSLLAAALCLAGCATMESGAAFDPAVAQQFEAGQTTRAQVEAALGPPVSVTSNSDGSSVIVYTHVVSSANSFSGRSQANANTAAFRFDANGVLVSSSVSSPAVQGRAR